MFGFFKDIVKSIKDTNKEIEAEAQIKHAYRSLRYIETQLASLPQHGQENETMIEVVEERKLKLLESIIQPLEYLEGLEHYDLNDFIKKQQNILYAPINGRIFNDKNNVTDNPTLRKKKFLENGIYNVIGPVSLNPKNKQIEGSNPIKSTLTIDGKNLAFRTLDLNGRDVTYVPEFQKEEISGNGFIMSYGSRDAISIKYNIDILCHIEEDEYFLHLYLGKELSLVYLITVPLDIPF